MSNFEKSVIALCMATCAWFIPLVIIGTVAGIPDDTNGAICCAWMFICALWLGGAIVIAGHQ
jgi:hypothetical protein